MQTAFEEATPVIILTIIIWWYIAGTSFNLIWMLNRISHSKCWLCISSIHAPTSPPRHLNFWKLAYSNSLPVRQKLCSNAPANFLLKAKSVAITFYIDPTLKLRPCFWRLFGNENKIFTFKHLHIKRYNNCIPLDVLDSSGVNPYLPQDFVKTQQLQILLHNTQPWTVLQGKCLWS